MLVLVVEGALMMVELSKQRMRHDYGSCKSSNFLSGVYPWVRKPQWSLCVSVLFFHSSTGCWLAICKCTIQTIRLACRLKQNCVTTVHLYTCTFCLSRSVLEGIDPLYFVGIFDTALIFIALRTNARCIVSILLCSIQCSVFWGCFHSLCAVAQFEVGSAVDLDSDLRGSFCRVIGGHMSTTLA